MYMLIYTATYIRMTYIYTRTHTVWCVSDVWLCSLSALHIKCSTYNNVYTLISSTLFLQNKFNNFTSFHGSVWYGVATSSRLLKIMGLFCRISSLLKGSFAKETYNFKEPTNRSHPIALGLLIYTRDSLPKFLEGRFDEKLESRTHKVQETERDVSHLVFPLAPSNVPLYSSLFHTRSHINHSTLHSALCTRFCANLTIYPPRTDKCHKNLCTYM